MIESCKADLMTLLSNDIASNEHHLPPNAEYMYGRSNNTFLVCMYVISMHVTDIAVVITIAMCSEIITINRII